MKQFNLAIARSFNSRIIYQLEDGYINLTQMADATGRRIDNWLRLQSTQELIQEFDSQIASSDLREQSPALALITMTSGVKGQRGGGGTWAHPDIAIQFAQWCSPAFALQVSRWVRDVLEDRIALLESKSLSHDHDQLSFNEFFTQVSELAKTDKITARNLSKLALEAKKSNPKLFVGIDSSVTEADKAALNNDLTVADWRNTLDLSKPFEMRISEMHQQYRFWCRTNQVRSLGRQQFALELQRLGATKRRTNAGIFYSIAGA
ncbi:MAG: KilA-N domain-containing protein [Cyanobacteria bacterium P01_A01_bin.17]